MLYQLVDASTPTGGFAHSNTLEVAMQIQLVQSGQDLFHYTWEFLLQTTTTLVPFLIRACSIFRSGSSNSCRVEEWDQLDQTLAITVTSQVTNRASCFQGSALLRAYGQTFPEIGSVLKVLRKRIQVAHNPNQRGHAVTCFGAICGLIHVDERLCVSMFVYTTVRDMINAAIRLNLVGPLQGGHLIHQLCTKFDDLVLNQLDVSAMPVNPSDQVFQTAPLIEILANAHDRLYTRLFNS
jgi:urease accessory protein UreF